MVYPNAYWKLRENPGWSYEVKDRFRQGLQVAASNVLVRGEALSLLASMAAEEKNWNGAATYNEELIRSKNSRASSGTYLRLGRYYLNQKKHFEAKRGFLQALRTSEKPDRILTDLLWPYRRAGSLDLYIELCQEAARYDARVRRGLPLILGKAHFYNNELELAVQQLGRALLERETSEARRYLAEIAIKKRNWDVAELESQRATILDPKNSHYRYLFARSLQAQEKYESAMQAINQAIKHANPPRHHYYNTKGWLHWALRDYTAAQEAWLTGYQISPKNANYLIQIARAYQKLEDYSNTERYYLAALKLKPDDQQLRHELQAVRKLRGVSSSQQAPSSRQLTAGSRQ
jgi:tetratricopeptide (TPR) repeat protein